MGIFEAMVDTVCRYMYVDHCRSGCSANAIGDDRRHDDHVWS